MTWTQFFFSFEGRIGRRVWLYSWPSLLLFLFVLMALLPPDAFVRMVPFEEARARPDNVVAPFGYVFSAMMALVSYVALAASVKRCHDGDRSGWFLLLWLVPIVGQVWVLIELGFLPGTAGPNRFGPNRGQTADETMVA